MAIRYEVVDAEPLDIFMGVCKKCIRPRRETDTPYTLQAWNDEHRSVCDECGARVDMQRVYGVELGMSCDDRCMGATGNHCECSCGGVNHGAMWSWTGELLANALKAFRRTADKRKQTAEDKKALKVNSKLTAFQAWANEMPQKPIVDYLRDYDRHTDYPNPFLDSLVRWLKAHKPLTDKQLAAAQRTIARRIQSANHENRLSNVAPEVTPRDIEGMTLGVFTYLGKVYVAKPNRAGTRSYANEVVLLKGTDRQNENGEKVTFELQYAPGIVGKLREEHRMTDEDINAFMIKYRKCIVCGHGIKRDRTINNMMGRTCARNIGREWTK
jgi:hypothetical protein